MKQKKWNEYTKTKATEMRAVTPKDIEKYENGEVGSSVVLLHTSISAEDRKKESPKIGDMIARNPENHSDLWLVEKEYFNKNYKTKG